MNTKKGDSGVFHRRTCEAREAAGFSLTEAAKRLGFNNYQTLSAIEKGARKINAHELSDMARLYGRSLDYFFEADLSPDPVPLWRKSTDKGIKQTQRKFLAFLENYSNMENLLGLERRWKDIQPNYEKKDFSMQEVHLANRLGERTWRSLDLGSRPASNLLNVLENYLRIKILNLPMSKKNGISGACLVDDTLGVGILINAKEAPWRRNFDLAHELFHFLTWNLFTHKEVGDGTIKTKPEKYADAFASSLLLPRQHLLNALKEVVIDKPIKYIDVIELAKDFGVSTTAILWRLVNLKVLKKARVNKVLDDPKLYKLDRAMRRELYYKDKPPKFPTRYISLACRCLMGGKISRGVFAKYIGIDRAEIDGYLRRQGSVKKNYEKIAAT